MSKFFYGLDLTVPATPIEKTAAKKSKNNFKFSKTFCAESGYIVKETVYDPNKYRVECGDLSLYCAAMFGGPLY